MSLIKRIKLIMKLNNFMKIIFNLIRIKMCSIYKIID